MFLFSLKIASHYNGDNFKKVLEKSTPKFEHKTKNFSMFVHKKSQYHTHINSLKYYLEYNTPATKFQTRFNGT